MITYEKVPRFLVETVSRSSSQRTVCLTFLTTKTISKSTKKNKNINKQTNKNTVFYEKGSVVTKKKEFAIKEAHYSVFN